ncbi:MAG: DUF2723 domain-containing protein [Bacteroidales bacterium]
MSNYKCIDLIGGWLVFAIAAVVYGMTVEPSVSFWDCPEFITSASKLEVGHPPGAPIFMLVGNLFSHFATEARDIPFMINLMNALLSAGTILFLFRSVTYLSGKLLLKGNEKPSMAQTITIMACGFVGALTYTFSDTFWYSAVEGEVYAFSSFLTALAFWTILKWESEPNLIAGDRWLVFLAYIIGISIGVHLLNLLCIPAIAMVIYFKVSKHPSVKGSLISLSCSFLLIAGVLYLIIPGIVQIAGYGELLAVNYFKLTFHTGAILAFSIILSGLVFAVYISHRKANHIWNTVFMGLLVLVLGYSSYALIMIRACAETPMNQQSVKDPFSLRDYLGREQYGQAPLLYGRTFASTPAVRQDQNGKWAYDYDKGITQYRRTPGVNGSSDEYVKTGHKLIEKYDPNTCMWFPRMYSNTHANAYQAWIGKKIAVPSTRDNLQFFFSYQLNFMYWRYFMWNFVGRQNDIQGYGDKEHGNWITGISLFDRYVLGITANTTDQNKGKNVFYGLPLLLGLLGIGWQWSKRKQGKQQFLILFLLFFMTGLAIVIYLNQSPLQPRERDYAYAGSFYAFSIWIGLGVAAITEFIKKIKTSWSPMVIALSAGLLTLCIPLQMASQTWDDHNRTNRHICHDIALNYLKSLPEKGNPVIFVNGDNDTFPLWYAIEVEGFRKDVRACNIMYLTGGWYVSQMMMPAHDSPAFPLSLPRSYFMDDKNIAVAVNPAIRHSYLPDGSVKEVRIKDLILDFYQQNPGTTRYGEDPFEWSNIVKYWLNNPDESLRCIPTDKIHIRIDRNAVLASGMQIPENKEIPEVMVIDLKERSYLLRPGIVQIDMIKQCNWERPLYVAITAPQAEYVDLSDHLVLEGLAYRIVPYTIKNPDARFDLGRMYDRVMNQFEYGNLKQTDLYLDDANKGITHTLHLTMLTLSDALYRKGDTIKALNVLNKCREEISPSILKQIPYSNLDYQEQLYRLLETDTTP